MGFQVEIWWHHAHAILVPLNQQTSLTNYLLCTQSRSIFFFGMVNSSPGDWRTNSHRSRLAQSTFDSAPGRELRGRSRNHGCRLSRRLISAKLSRLSNGEILDSAKYA